MLNMLPLLLILGSDPLPVVNDDEQVILFPCSAARSADGEAWEFQLQGWIYETQWYSDAFEPLAATLGFEGDVRAIASDPVFRARAGLFLVDSERGERIAVKVGDAAFVSAESAENGHFTITGRLPRAAAAVGGRFCTAEVVVGEKRSDRFTGQIHLVEREGLSVISDIDDTIKISHVRDKRTLLRSTFLKPFEAVPGMAEVYTHWAAARGASFHYLSASPWQLYPPLRAFSDQAGFPAGSFHLKQFRWKDRSFFSLFDSPEAYKLPRIEELLDRYPQRRFVLVGDSGERDPEVYAAVAARHPGQIVRIFIRDVTDEAPDAARYRTLFGTLDPALWRIFRTPADIRDALP